MNDDFNAITKAIQAEASRYLAHLNSAKPLNDEFRMIKGRIVTLACKLLAAGNQGAQEHAASTSASAAQASPSHSVLGDAKERKA